MQLSPRSTGLFCAIVTCSGLADPGRSSIEINKFTASAKRLGERLLTTPANQIHYIFSWESF